MRIFGHKSWNYINKIGVFGKSDRQLIVCKIIMNKSFSAGQMVFGLFGLIWILGVNKKAVQRKLRGTWDFNHLKMTVHLIKK